MSVPTDTPVPPTHTPRPTDTLAPTSTPRPTETPVPTNTRAPTNTPPPTATAVALTEADEAAFGESYTALLFIYMGAELVNEAAIRTEGGQLEGFEGLGALLAIGLIVENAEDSLADLTAPVQLSEHLSRAAEVHVVVKDVMKRWTDKEITSAQVLTELEGPLGEIRAIMDQVDSVIALTFDVDIAELTQGREEAMAELSDVFESAQTPEPAGTPTLGSSSPPPRPGESSASPTPDSRIVGMSRGNPVELGEVAVAANWDFRVTEVQRGEPAWAALQAANRFNDPAPEGMEYVLVKIWVKAKHQDQGQHSISGSDFKLTGDRYVEYFQEGAVNPDPDLRFQVVSGAEVEGWSSYLVGQEEGNLMLLFDELADYDDARYRYAAIEKGATLGVPPELAGIEPTQLGATRDAPAPLGETVTTQEWEMTVTEVIRGEEAWKLLLAANQFNDPPDDGMEYVLVRVRVRLVAAQELAEYVNGYDMRASGSAGIIYEPRSLVEPEPRLDVALYPGGIHEGWVALQIAAGEAGIMMVYESLFDFTGENTRYLSLE